MTWNEIKAAFRQIVGNYDGQLLETSDEIHYKAKNEIASYYDNGKVCRKAKVVCDVYAFNRSYGIILGAHEKTYEILGGQSGHEFDEEQLTYLLERYCFKRRTKKQMSIFDL